MNNEINKTNTVKESGNNKSKWSMQNILAVLIFVAIVAIIFILFIISHAPDMGDPNIDVSSIFGHPYLAWLSLFFVGAFVIIGMIITSVVVGVTSSVKLAKNKEQLTSLEEKSKKKWYIFDIISFLVVPVVIIIIYIIFRNVWSSIMQFLIFISLASGIRAIIRNKKGGTLSRIAGWFLIIFGLMFIFGIVYNFLII